MRDEKIVGFLGSGELDEYIITCKQYVSNGYFFNYSDQGIIKTRINKIIKLGLELHIVERTPKLRECD